MRVIIFCLAALPNILSFPFPDCGINYIEPDNIQNASRIVGGVEAVPGSWPWAAYLRWRGEYTCGGTLISDMWVLSAGHCFYTREEPGDWEIVMGEHDRAPSRRAGSRSWPWGRSSCIPTIIQTCKESDKESV